MSPFLASVPDHRCSLQFLITVSYLSFLSRVFVAVAVTVPGPGYSSYWSCYSSPAPFLLQFLVPVGCHSYSSPCKFLVLLSCYICSSPFFFSSSCYPLFVTVLVTVPCSVPGPLTSHSYSSPFLVQFPVPFPVTDACPRFLSQSLVPLLPYHHYLTSV